MGGSDTVPSRSIFGARLRSRLPQYGHSVMYGDTSRPQLRHTTNRSGPLAILISILRAPRGRSGYSVVAETISRSSSVQSWFAS